MTEKTVTISCRITPEQKMKLAQKSEKLGMKLCNYIELLVLYQFENDIGNDFQNQVQAQNENDLEKDSDNEKQPTFQTVIFDETKEQNQVAIFEQFMEELQEQHQDSSASELINAALIHAVKNEKAFVQRSLSVFLNRLKKGNYDN